VTAQALQELRSLSAALGSDAQLIQGAGGNTSVKDAGVLWVKASGKWLDAAAEAPIFVAMDLQAVRRHIVADDAEAVASEVIEGLSPPGLRPSIEASLHALLPHRFVVHVHSVNTISWAVQMDAESALHQPLRGLRWCWLPYIRPGMPLTQAARLATKSHAADVLVMGNHGLVVGADSVQQVAALLADVEQRLARAPRAPVAPQIERLAARARGSRYRLPLYEEAHGVATDSVNLRLVTGGSLYPDHVVFLGPGVTLLGCDESIDELLRRVEAAGRAPPALLLVAGEGVLVLEDISRGGEEMVRCLAMVAGRIPVPVGVNYLSDAQAAELLAWDAEIYRR
jgi:rhamnose utilization protein RhaD (predicted bifunctional aldolase and dehydrogenase)